MIKLADLLGESDASDEAKQKGLDYLSFGRYGKDGKVTHVVDPQTHKLVPKPDTSRTSGVTPLAKPDVGTYGNSQMSAAPKSPSSTRPLPVRVWPKASQSARVTPDPIDIRTPVLPDIQRVPMVRPPTADEIDTASEHQSRVERQPGGVNYNTRRGAGNPGMMLDLRKHDGNALELAQVYHKFARLHGLDKPTDWPAERTDALAAYIRQHYPPTDDDTENPEYTPSDSSNSPFGPDQ